MDNEEVDIGTVRNVEDSLQVTSNFDTDVVRFSAKTALRGLASPSAPDIVKDYPLADRRVGSSLSRVKTLPHLRHKSGGASNPELAPLEIDKVGRIRRWILCVVDFDLDVGPVLSSLYPPLRLSAAWRENIAFSSFPDSSIFDTGSQAHSFKLAASANSSTNPQPASEDILLSNDGFMYGYAFFVQRRDSTSKRGYLQRSVVVLSHHPYPSLFEEVVSILAPLYLLHGNAMLDSACQNISNWRDPTPGSVSELGFLGSVLQVHLPRTQDEVQFPETLSLDTIVAPRPHILVSIPKADPSILTVFSACLSSLWPIWELLMLCEPILVFGTSPRITSLAVWWLRDFIRPIPFGGDFRPYITIHDQDYTSLINKDPPKVGLLVGATNPFMLSVTKHWPNVLSLGWDDHNLLSKTPKPKYSQRDNPGSGPPPGFVSRAHKRFISKDRPLLKTWEEALLKGGHAEQTASQTLRRHFSSRTVAFLAPLNRYLNSLIPSPAEMSAANAKEPRLKPFNSSHFLTSLKAHATPLPFKSTAKRQEFYERWLRTPAFALWLTSQEEVVRGVLSDTQRSCS